MSLFSVFAGDLRLTTVVIDPGHGGKDAGAVSKDRKTLEKNLTLDISRRLSEMIKEGFPEVKVILTRSRDEFISLNDRAVRANKSEAQLFISVHINSTSGTVANGYSIHILGQSSNRNRDLFAYNLDVCKRENSVILLEDDYSTKYQGFDPSDPESFIFMQLMQNAHLEQSLLFAGIVSEKLKGGPIRADRGIWQNPFYVLWKTSMPAVLLELGFISNSEDLAVLRNEAKRIEISRRLYEAFSEYKQVYDKSVTFERDTTSAPAAVPVTQTPALVEPEAEKTRYGTQIFAVGRRIPDGDGQFLGYKPVVVRSGSVYKYIIGVEPTKEGARRENERIKKKYPGCFMVEISGENISRLR